MIPILIDVSLREPCFGAATGHTLANKQALLPLVDDFYQYLLEKKYDMTGCFALTEIGRMNGSQFMPHLSMEKLIVYRI